MARTGRKRWNRTVPFNTGPSHTRTRPGRQRSAGAAGQNPWDHPAAAGARRRPGPRMSTWASCAATATSDGLRPARRAMRACWRRVSSATTGSSVSRCEGPPVGRDGGGGLAVRRADRAYGVVLTELELDVEDALEGGVNRWNSARSRVSRSGRPSRAGSMAAALPAATASSRASQPLSATVRVRWSAQPSGVGELAVAASRSGWEWAAESWRASSVVSGRERMPVRSPPSPP